jgi:hypothetical protein
MFVERVALDPVPDYARIAPGVLNTVLARMVGTPADLSKRLDASFHELERRQPCLADFIAREIAQLNAPSVQALAYFLAVLVYASFQEAFGVRLAQVERSDVMRMFDRLIADGELRSGGAAGASYSEDAIAIGQPALVSLLRSEVDRALAEDPDGPWESLDAFYESLLVMVLVLTQAVAPRSRRA